MSSAAAARSGPLLVGACCVSGSHLELVPGTSSIVRSRTNILSPSTSHPHSNLSIHLTPTSRLASVAPTRPTSLQLAGPALLPPLASPHSNFSPHPHHSLARTSRHSLARTSRHSLARASRHSLARASRHSLARTPRHSLARTPRHSLARTPRHSLARTPRHSLTEPLASPLPSARSRSARAAFRAHHPLAVTRRGASWSNVRLVLATPGDSKDDRHALLHPQNLPLNWMRDSTASARQQNTPCRIPLLIERSREELLRLVQNHC
jgi:hypothetical protein